MRVELHISSSNQVQLKPETAMERALLDEMLLATSKGKSVSFSRMGDTECAVMSVEK